MKKLFFLPFLLILISPIKTSAGFPEGEEGYDLKKIEESFRLPCDEIGKDECIARAFGVGACTWIFGLNKGKESDEALRIADSVLIALMKGNNLEINSVFKKDGSIKEVIQKEAINRINFCKDATKLAIPKLIKKLPEGIELDDEKIENLASVFPLQYLSMFEQMKKNNLDLNPPISKPRY